MQDIKCSTCDYYVKARSCNIYFCNNPDGLPHPIATDYCSKWHCEDNETHNSELLESSILNKVYNERRELRKSF